MSFLTDIIEILFNYSFLIGIMSTFAFISSLNLIKELSKEHKQKKYKIKEGNYDIIMGNPKGSNKIKPLGKMTQSGDRIKIELINDEVKYILVGKYNINTGIITGRIKQNTLFYRKGTFFLTPISESNFKGILKIYDKTKFVGKQISLSYKSELHIRGVESSDKLRIASIYEESFGEALPSKYINKTATSMIKIAECSKSVVGFIIGDRLSEEGIEDYFKSEIALPDDLYTKIQKGRAGYIKKFAVDTEFQEMGLATRLIKEAIRDQISNGIEIVFTISYQTEAEVLSETLFTSLGFKLFTSIPELKQSGKEAMVYIYGIE
jgi:ribosomal protein S18 acetylase RimI-like enzyme